MVGLVKGDSRGRRSFVLRASLLLNAFLGVAVLFGLFRRCDPAAWDDAASLHARMPPLAAASRPVLPAPTIGQSPQLPQMVPSIAAVKPKAAPRPPEPPTLQPHLELPVLPATTPSTSPLGKPATELPQPTNSPSSAESLRRMHPRAEPPPSRPELPSTLPLVSRTNEPPRGKMPQPVKNQRPYHQDKFCNAHESVDECCDRCEKSSGCNAVVFQNDDCAYRESNKIGCSRALQFCQRDAPAGGPPCCSRLLLQMVHMVTDTLESLGIDVALRAGTCVGAMRDGTVLPWVTARTCLATHP